MKRATSQRLGESNRLLVLNQLRRRGVASMDQLVRDTGRSQPTVLKWLGALERSGQVRRRGVGASSGGRPPTLYEYVAEAGYVLGIAVEIPSVSLTLIDMSGRAVFSEVRSIQSLGPSDAVLRELQDLLDSFVGQHLTVAQPLVAAGVAFSGFIDRGAGLSLASPRLRGWENVPVRAHLEGHLGVPVALNHHIDALTEAELHVGSAVGVGDFLFFDFGYGLGLRAVRAGRPLLGRFGNAGLIGHTTVVPDGRLCLCGNRGCLEEYVSGRALLRHARAGVGAHDEDAAIARTVASLFDEHDSGGRADLRGELERFLAIGLANAINTFDQPRVVLSGFTAAGGTAFRERIVQRTHALLQPTLAAATDITFSRLPRSEAGAHGAALFALRQQLPFADPLVTTNRTGGQEFVTAERPTADPATPTDAPSATVSRSR